MSEIITRDVRQPSRGRTAGLVPFVFGLLGRATLPGPVLRRLLEDLGVSPDAGRALLSRMTRAGQLTAERHGRTAEYRLAGELARGFHRIQTQGSAQPASWSGGFPAVLYQVPEEHREFRDAFRRAAVLAGYGVLQPGVLISMTELGTRLDEVLAGRPPEARVWPARIELSVDAAAAAASVAWGLPDLADVYQAHIARLSEPAQPSLREYVDTLMPVLVDTLREPRLPVELRPAGWPGPALRQAIGGYNAAVLPGFQGYLDELLSPWPADS